MIRRTLFPSPVHRRMAPLIAASFFGGVALWVPVEKLFLGELGFTPQTVGLMAAAYAAVVPLLEIPSGILADRWSRRGVLLLGNAGAFLSVLVGALSFNVATYLVAALLLGVYFAMQSGTLDAIVYDTVLEEDGNSERFESLLGRVRMLESVSLVVGALAGGVLAAATAPRVTYVATLPFIALSTLFLVAFREPHLHEAAEPRSLRQHVAVTFGVCGGTGGSCRWPHSWSCRRSSRRPCSSSGRCGWSTREPVPARSARPGRPSWPRWGSAGRSPAASGPTAPPPCASSACSWSGPPRRCW